MPDSSKAGAGAAGSDTEGRLIAAIEDLWKDSSNSFVNLAGGDDCAVLGLADTGDDLLLTTDQVVEGRHFLRSKHPPDAVGRKALVRSLSDIAAMGGRPACLLQTVCLPSWALGEWHEAFQRGMREAADEAGAGELVLGGGDVAGGDRFVATATVVGRIERGTALRRDGARPGDAVWVSGALGGAGMGLAMVLGTGKPDWSHPAVRRHCAPTARLQLGRILRAIPATAAIDLSDGLAIDANRLAAASGVSVILDPGCLPLFPGARQEDAITSGEEHELLFTLPAGAVLPEHAQATVIGRIEAGKGAWLEAGKDCVPLPAEGFSHF